ncbi:cation transporter [Candidatus Woesearchaeota archaeon]|nr:cation transporter [Candidatus Woesearchaeota archaeon]
MPSMDKGDMKALKITSWLTGIYFIVELGLGLYSGSVAVISDAFHTFSAVGGVLLALIAGRIALRPADKFKSFGRLRAEIIGALLNGFFLLIMAILVLVMGYMRLKQPIELPTTPMFIAAAGGLITEAISIKLLFKGQKHSLNVKGAYWHVLQTFVGSIVIIIAAVVIKLTGFNQIDPILGMLFGLVLLWASWSIIKGAFDILLESAPPNIDLDEVRKKIESIRGVQDVHHIHAWVLTSGKNIFSSHVRISPNVDSEKILSKVYSLLKDGYKFYFSTIQAEKKCYDTDADHIDITKKVE